MRCAKATSLLQAYLDNELTSSQEARLNHHLQGCSICRLQLSALRQTSEAMSLWKDKESRKDLVSPVIQRLRYEQDAPSVFQHFIEIVFANKRKILAVGANLLILILLAFNIPLFFRTPPATQPVTIGNTNPMGISGRHPSVRLEPLSLPSYDPVDMAATLNDAVDAYNLKPAERDMVFDNLLNDANDVMNGNALLPSASGEVKYRRIQVIYVRGSKQNPVVQRVIFTQQMRYENTK